MRDDTSESGLLARAIRSKAVREGRGARREDVQDVRRHWRGEGVVGGGRAGCGRREAGVTDDADGVDPEPERHIIVNDLLVGPDLDSGDLVHVGPDEIEEHVGEKG